MIKPPTLLEQLFQLKTGRTITDYDMAEAMISEGTVLGAAEKLGCCHTYLQHRISANPDLKAVEDQMRDGLFHQCERKFKELVAAGKEKSVLYGLSTLGKKRGYGKEITVNVNKIEDSALKEAAEQLGLDPDAVIEGEN